MTVCTATLSISLSLSLSLSLYLSRGFESGDGLPLLTMSLADFCNLANKGLWKHCAFIAASIEKKLGNWNKNKMNGEEVPDHLKKECQVY